MNTIKIPKIDLLYIITFLLIVNSGLHINGVPTYYTMYLTFYPALIYFVYYIFKYKRITCSVQTILCILFCIYLLFSQIIVGGDIIVLLASIITFLFYFLSVVFLPHIKLNNIFIISNSLLVYNGILNFIDFFYRIMHIGHYNGNFYTLKISLLYSDTNAIGINTVTLLFFAYYLYVKTKNNMYLFFCILYFLFTVFSLSRVAILASLLTFVIIALFKFFRMIWCKRTETNFFIFKIRELYLVAIFLFCIIASAIYIPKIVEYISQDGSFGTKIKIITDMFTFWDTSGIISNILGIGYDNAHIYLRRYAHNYLATYFIETGVVGYILITSFLLSILYKTPKTIYILLPYTIIGTSYIGHTILNLFYCVLALIWIIEKYSIRNNNIPDNQVKKENY